MQETSPVETKETLARTSLPTLKKKSKSHQLRLPNFYEETDAGVAAFIIVRGNPLVGIRRLAHQTVFQFFGPNIKQYVAGYFKGEWVPAKKYMKTQHELSLLIQKEQK